MNALVTGGGGFIGRHVVEQLLARGDAVTVFARGRSPAPASSVATSATPARPARPAGGST